ncbi:MAG: lysine exporter LysO family protein, partial [Bacteroidaceae bacterium]|nr:lysine exporter LysO family protein [Bacteroidaceae bacterium]
MKGSLIIIGFFLLGVACGVAHLVPAWITDYNFYVLCALLFAVGMSVGIDGSMVQRFRALNPRLAWLPVCSILGTLAGSVVAWLLVPREVTEVLAVGSGFGYYSLSSILITEYSGAELGKVALLANIT